MKKRKYLYLGILISMFGCSDGADEHSADPCGSCRGDQVCLDNECRDKVVCEPACGEDENCVEGKCEKKPTEDPKEPEDVCEPACSGQYDTCLNGRCAFCIGNQCFYEGKKSSDCKADDDCEDKKVCREGVCVDKEEVDDDVCEPSCQNGQTCVKGKCLNQTALWTLCRTGSDCGVGECIFDVLPSRSMTLNTGDSYKQYDASKHIPLSVIDPRINVDNYNKTHSNQAEADDVIGICSFDCTEKASRCPIGWSCQLVAKGDSLYPGLDALPSPLKSEDMELVGYAAVCRRDMNEKLAESLPYGVEMCKSDKSACDAAGGIFYKGMCLDNCSANDVVCPYMFTCTEIDNDGKQAKVCFPDSGTCSDCYDADGDGAGYGHCPKKVMDCNDDDASIYVGKELTCDDIVDADKKSVLTDKNCNGIIDRFELMGTVSNCQACGSACKVPESVNLAVVCDAVEKDVLTSDWRESATFDMEDPAFKCVEKCAFGFGDCNGNARCDAALLTSNARETAEYSEEFSLSILDVLIGSKAASVFALDNDGDGYPAIDVAGTQNAEVLASERRIMLDGANTLICCSGNADLCYSADPEWVTTSVKERENIENIIDEEHHDVVGSKYVEIKFPAQADAKVHNSVNYYDSNDFDASIHPGAVEKCDGRDNDGSTLLSGSGAISCKVFCSGQGATGTELSVIEDICKSFADVVDGCVVYRPNAYCDVTPDGSSEPVVWTDDADSTEHFYGDSCKMRHSTGTVCSSDGTIACKSEPKIWCAAGTENCSCGLDSLGAFRIVPERTFVDEVTGSVSYKPDAEHYIKQAKWVGDDIDAEFCLCDGSKCSEGQNCEGKDSERCYELCHIHCQKNLAFGLSCVSNASSDKLDGIVKDDSGNLSIVFDGIDDNCDGIPDESANVPCVITAEMDYNEYSHGVSSLYKAYISDDDYELPVNNETDNSINLCKLGMLKRGKQMNADGTFKGVCEPIFEPRAYDFYGDGIDSNCDGVDYDLKHTVLVASESQGDIQGGVGDCHFDKKGLAHPCPTIRDAIEKAKAQNNNTIFYHDIFVTGSSFALNTTDNIGIAVPEAKNMKDLDKRYVFLDNRRLNEEGYQGHFLDAASFHRSLVEHLKSDSSFNPNHYLFKLDKRKTKTVIVDGEKKTEYQFEPQVMEKDQPDEYVRIYGGFTRAQNSSADLLAEKDFWSQTGETTLNYIPNLNVNNGSRYYSFSMFSVPRSVTGKMSLLLSHFKLQMGQSEASSLGDEEALPYNYVDGVTYIGINGTQGIERLNLDNVELNVSAPVGYGFTQAALDGSNGNGGLSAERDTRNWNDYISLYNANACQRQSGICGFGNSGVFIERSIGGCGGYADGHTSSGASSSKGKSSSMVVSGIHGEYTSYTSGAIGKLKDDGGCDRNVSKDNDEIRGDYDGAAGAGGGSGMNGRSSDIVMKWAMADRSIYVFSDRSSGKGHYGFQGGGGGGASVKWCWYGNKSDNTDCFAGSGGNGGCGGEGGEAGGTGGSALGIVLRSNSKTLNSSNLFMTSSKVSVTPGSGGLQQKGGNGGNGGEGGSAFRYAREGAANWDTQCQRMGAGGPGGGGGAGGAGAGGRRGWAYPFVFACSPNLDVNFDDNSELASLAQCGFNIPEDLVNNPSDYGSQNLSGIISYADATSNNGKGGMGGVTKSLRLGGSKSERDDPRPGGIGGQADELTGDEDTSEHSCQKLNADGNGYHSIIVKMLTH